MSTLHKRKRTFDALGPHTLHLLHTGGSVPVGYVHVVTDPVDDGHLLVNLMDARAGGSGVYDWRLIDTEGATKEECYEQVEQVANDFRDKLAARAPTPHELAALTRGFFEAWDILRKGTKTVNAGDPAPTTFFDALRQRGR